MQNFFAFRIFSVMILSGFDCLVRFIDRGPNRSTKDVRIMDEFQARRLVTAYADMILRISYQYLKQTQDAEDICQTVFLKYLSNNCEFDSVEHEKAWIIRATINTCKDHLKSAFFRRTVPLEEAVQVAAPAVPDRPILDAMKQLPKHYRISIYLYYYEDYSAREIGQILGKSEATINQYLSRGRKKLETYLTEERRQTV